MGGPAARLVTAETIDELVDAVREVDDADEPLLVVSGGSNLVIADDGFPGTVVRIATSGVTVESADLCGGVMVRVAAGVDWDEFVAQAVAEGWSGVEALSGIPGATGATPVQNVGRLRPGGGPDHRLRAGLGPRRAAGAHLQQRSTAPSPTGTRIFKAHQRYVVLDVLFQLLPSELGPADRLCRPGPSARASRPGSGCRSATPARRCSPSAGTAAWCSTPRTTTRGRAGRSSPTRSCASRSSRRSSRARPSGSGPTAPTPPRFADPDGNVKTSAAWLIDNAGFGKGYGLPGPRGAVDQAHPRHHQPGRRATATDVAALAREIRDGVREAFGVTLVNEPVFVGHEL